MDDKQASVSQICKTYVRPDWPYEDWKCVERKFEGEDGQSAPKKFDVPTPRDISTEGEIRANIGGCSSTNDPTSHDTAANEAEKQVVRKMEFFDKSDQVTQGTLLEDAEGFEPDHWAEDLSVPLDDNLPLCHLLRFMKPELNCNEVESKEILEEMNEMMRKTTEKLESCYLVFEKCFIIPVGSMTENTKIGKADEFDYAVVLPYFESFDKLFPIIFKKDESLLYDDPAYRALTKDIACDGDTVHIQENFQAAMKEIWSLYVVDFIPEGWKLSAELSCCGGDRGIARTFHLVRSSDGFTVDIDICFWVSIHKSTLEERGDYFEQRDYLLANCFDNEMKLFALLPEDHNIDYSLNIVRFAMSLKEREELNKYGPMNGRIQCYKFAKCIAKFFIPHIQKKENCSRCLDCLVSSFALKNVVLSMASNYPDDTMWTDDQLGNRVCEVFAILNFCMKVNCSLVSAFLTPYTIQLRTLSDKYDSAKGMLVKKGINWLSNEDQEPRDHCFLPEVKRFDPLFREDPISKKVLQNYFCFLQESDWSVPEVFDRLTEMLTGLRENDEDERRQYAENPGCLCFQPFSA